MIYIIIIKPLYEHKECLSTVIDWISKEFGTEDNRAFFESIINHSLVKESLPLTFVAFENNDLIGTIGLWRSDLMSRQDLFPWLSALFVKENYRNKGVGARLQSFLIDYCKNAGYNEIFLYTNLDNYYEKYGFKYFENGVEFSGDIIKIYHQKLT